MVYAVRSNRPIVAKNKIHRKHKLSVHEANMRQFINQNSVSVILRADGSPVVNIVPKCHTVNAE